MTAEGISHPSGYFSKKMTLRLMNSTTSLIIKDIDRSSRWSVISLLTRQGSRFQTLASVLQHPSCRCMESIPVYWSTIIMIILLFAVSQMTERNTFSPLTCLLIIVAEIHWKPLIPIAAINLCANWNKHCFMSKTTNSWQTGKLFCSGKGRSSAIRSTQVVQAVGKRREKGWAQTAEVCFLPELQCLRHSPRLQVNFHISEWWMSSSSVSLEGTL